MSEELTELARRLAPRTGGRLPPAPQRAAPAPARAAPAYAALLMLATLCIAMGLATMLAGGVVVALALAKRDPGGWPLDLVASGVGAVVSGLFLAGFGEALRAFRDLVRNSFR